MRTSREIDKVWIYSRFFTSVLLVLTAAYIIVNEVELKYKNTKPELVESVDNLDIVNGAALNIYNKSKEDLQVEINYTNGYRILVIPVEQSYYLEIPEGKARLRASGLTSNKTVIEEKYYNSDHLYNWTLN